MIRVLHVVGKLNIGGAESRIMDLYRNIDRTQIQFDFMQHTPQICAYQQEVESLGGHVYHVPRFRIYNILSYQKSWKKFFKEHPEIQVVHGHMTSTAGIYLPIAARYGHAYTIAHARSAGVDNGIKGRITRLLRRNLSKKCDQCFTCSELAGDAVFGKKAMEDGLVKIVPNAIDVSKFVFDRKRREQIRKQYGIAEDNFVVGHVGRFDTVKNHAYLLDIFEKCYHKNQNFRLMLVGDGPLREEMENRAKQLGIEQQVIFTGNQKNVADYYQAFDFFLLPSFYEGLPGTAIEAQTCGVAGILSDTVTEEAIITDLMWQKSIDLAPEEWADEIIEYQKNNKNEDRRSRVEEVRNAGFDVKQQAMKLSEFYQKAVKQ